MKSFLTAAATSYTNSNTSSIVTTYSNGNSSSNRLDTPSPVSLSWTGSANSIEIYEGTSTSGTAVKTQTFTSSSTADVYNLIPGRTYSYRTSNGQTGTFTTEGRRRMIKVSDSYSASHANNCRDLGGISTKNGKTLAYGLIYRGTNMDSTTDSEKAILRDDLGIKLDVDLRENGSKKSSSPLGSGVDITEQYYSPSLSDLTKTSNIGPTLKSIMTYVSQGKPVYIHCKIGSDRTGFVCMLVESLLGVPLKESDIDYELTSFASGVPQGSGGGSIGSRTRNTSFSKEFRGFFIKGDYSNDTVPEAVENYVLTELKSYITSDLLASFRKAMGVSETIS